MPWLAIYPKPCSLLFLPLILCLPDLANIQVLSRAQRWSDTRSLKVGGCAIRGGDRYCQRFVPNSFCSFAHDQCFCTKDFVSVYEPDISLACKPILSDLRCQADVDCTQYFNSVCHPGVGHCTCTTGSDLVVERAACYPRVELDLEARTLECQRCRQVGGWCYYLVDRPGSEQDSHRTIQCACPDNKFTYVRHEASSSTALCRGKLVGLGEVCDGRKVDCQPIGSVCSNKPTHMLPLTGPELAERYYGHLAVRDRENAFGRMLSPDLKAGICTCLHNYLPVLQSVNGEIICQPTADTEDNQEVCQSCLASGGVCYVSRQREADGFALEHSCGCYVSPEEVGPNARQSAPVEPKVSASPPLTDESGRSTATRQQGSTFSALVDNRVLLNWKYTRAQREGGLGDKLPVCTQSNGLEDATDLPQTYAPTYVFHLAPASRKVTVSPGQKPLAPGSLQFIHCANDSKVAAIRNGDSVCLKVDLIRESRSESNPLVLVERCVYQLRYSKVDKSVQSSPLDGHQGYLVSLDSGIKMLRCVEFVQRSSSRTLGKTAHLIGQPFRVISAPSSRQLQVRCLLRRCRYRSHCIPPLVSAPYRQSKGIGNNSYCTPFKPSEHDLHEDSPEMREIPEIAVYSIVRTSIEVKIESPRVQATTLTTRPRSERVGAVNVLVETSTFTNHNQSQFDEGEHSGWMPSGLLLWTFAGTLLVFITFACQLILVRLREPNGPVFLHTPPVDLRSHPTPIIDNKVSDQFSDAPPAGLSAVEGHRDGKRKSHRLTWDAIVGRGAPVGKRFTASVTYQQPGCTLCPRRRCQCPSTAGSRHWNNYIALQTSLVDRGSAQTTVDVQVPGASGSTSMVESGGCTSYSGTCVAARNSHTAQDSPHLKIKDPESLSNVNLQLDQQNVI